MSKTTSILSQRSRCWVFTLWNPSEADLDHLRAAVGPVLGLVGLESPNDDDKRTHLQGFARWKSARSGSAVKKWLGRNDVHLELPISTDYANWQYCKKEGNVIVQWGEEPAEPTKTGVASDWDFVRDQVLHGKSMLSILDEKPHMTRYVSAIRQYVSEVEVKQQAAWRDVQTTYVWGAAGIGKSRAIMEKHGAENVYRITDKKNPWDGYRGEPVVVFEEYRSNFGVENMLNWLDGYPIMLPCRYANRPAQFTQVYLLTNIPLWEQFEGVQMNHAETWGAFLRRIDAVVLGCANTGMWHKWPSISDFAAEHHPAWLPLLRGTRAVMENSLQDLL